VPKTIPSVIVFGQGFTLITASKVRGSFRVDCIYPYKTTQNAQDLAETAAEGENLKKDLTYNIVLHLLESMLCSRSLNEKP
jgi:hypothetical protein